MAKPASAASVLGAFLAALLLINGCATTTPTQTTTSLPAPAPKPPGWTAEDKNLRSIPSTVFAIDKKGNHVVGGNYAGELRVGKMPIDLSKGGGQTRPLPGPDAAKPEDPTNAYVAKLSPRGELVWSVELGGPGDQRVTGVAVDAENKLIVTGVFNETVALEGETLTRPKEDELLLSGVFVAKLDENGKKEWFRPIAQASAVESVSVALGPRGEPVVNLTFVGKVKLGDAPVQTYHGRSMIALGLSGEGQATPLYAQSLDIWTCVTLVCFFMPHCCNCCWDQACNSMAQAICGW